MTQIRIATFALDDHLSRLYDVVTHDDTYTHVDGPHAGTITVTKWGDKVTTVTMNEPAIREFMDDMDYQVEFMDAPYQRDYRNQCRRALASMRKQANRVATS